MRSPTSSRRARSGCTCRRNTATGGASTTGCGCGRSTAPGNACSPRYWPRPTRRATSTGWCRWTPRSFALPARCWGPRGGAPTGEPADHAIGRSRGGLTTKIRLAADGRCRPLVFVLTGGQADDAPAFPQVMARLRVPRRRGRPRAPPDVVLADKAYASRSIREHLRSRRIRAVIPSRADQNSHRLPRGSRGGRLPAFDREAYKQRNTVERCINRLKQWRGIATRYEKTATVYLAGLHIAGIFLWSAR